MGWVGKGENLTDGVLVLSLRVVVVVMVIAALRPQRKLGSSGVGNWRRDRAVSKHVKHGVVGRGGGVGIVVVFCPCFFFGLP